jgi:hypothetical protein
MAGTGRDFAGDGWRLKRSIIIDSSLLTPSRGNPPVTKTITSYFGLQVAGIERRRIDVERELNCSSSQRVCPEGMEPPYVSHSATRRAAWIASPGVGYAPGRRFLAACSTMVRVPLVAVM